MTAIRDRVIDWRSQMAALQPYLKGLGGVIHIHVGINSPGSAFAKALCTLMKDGQWPFPWRSVQFDYNDASTHYAFDIIRQIAKSTGIPATSAGMEQPHAIAIAKDIRAGGNVNIENINVTVESSRLQAGYDIDKLCDALREQLATQRVALLFMNSHQYNRPELARMRRTIWDGALEELINHGLLLLDFSEPQQISDPTLWPPDPCLVIELNDKYDAISRRAAGEDLAQIAYEEGLVTTPEEAEGFAKAMLMTSYNIRDMYARLALCLIEPRVEE
jgi:hypothetical protein